MRVTMNHETAYRVKIANPVHKAEYIVIAASFDKAAQMALAAEGRDGQQIATVQHIEVYGGAGCVLGETR